MDDDKTDDRTRTESMRLLLVHDAENEARNLAATSDEDPHLEDDIARRAKLLRDGLQVGRFPEYTPVASTTDAHWTAQYQGRTAPAARTDTPPPMAATIIDITDPGRDIGPMDAEALPTPRVADRMQAHRSNDPSQRETPPAILENPRVEAVLRSLNFGESPTFLVCVDTRNPRRTWSRDPFAPLASRQAQ